MAITIWCPVAKCIWWCCLETWFFFYFCPPHWIFALPPPRDCLTLFFAWALDYMHHLYDNCFWQTKYYIQKCKNGSHAPTSISKLSIHSHEYIANTQLCRNCFEAVTQCGSWANWISRKSRQTFHRRKQTRQMIHICFSLSSRCNLNTLSLFGATRSHQHLKTTNGNTILLGFFSFF